MRAARRRCTRRTTTPASSRRCRTPARCATTSSRTRTSGSCAKCRCRTTRPKNWRAGTWVPTDFRRPSRCETCIRGRRTRASIRRTAWAARAGASASPRPNIPRSRRRSSPFGFRTEATMTYSNSRPRNSRRAGRPASALWRTTALLAAAAFIVGCDTGRLLDVKAPNSVPATVFDDPANAALMVSSAVGDFECAFGGWVVATGIATDELQDGTLTAANWQMDRRDDGFTSGSYGTAGCTGTQAIYTPMSTARWEADQAVTKLAGWTDAQVANRVSLLVQANVYAGFSYATLGMSMCQAAFDLGPLVDQKGMFALAEKRFSDAITASTGVAALSSYMNAAYVGRARVRLYQHNLAGAASDAQLVPKGFVFNAAMDANISRRYSHVYQAIVQNTNTCL